MGSIPTLTTLHQFSRFSIEGRGTVATGRIEQGVVHPGDKVEIVGLGDKIDTTVTSVEAFNKQRESAKAGDNVGVLLRGVKHDQIERGQVIVTPKSLVPRTKFKAEVYVLSKDEGGRHTPFFAGYTPQFYFHTTDVTGKTNLVGAEMCMPGENITLEVELQKPVALTKGGRFAIREGGKTVGSGRVTAVE